MHTVGSGLHPGAVGRSHILHPQLVGGGEQGSEQRADALAQRVGVLPGKGLGVQHDALNAQLFGRLLGSFRFGGLFGCQPHGSACHGKTLLLQNAHRHGAGGGVGHLDQDLVLALVGVEPVPGQKSIVHVPCLPPCALLCATASWSQRSFSGWPAWPLTQT